MKQSADILRCFKRMVKGLCCFSLILGLIILLCFGWFKSSGYTCKKRVGLGATCGKLWIYLLLSDCEIVTLSCHVHLYCHIFCSNASSSTRGLRSAGLFTRAKICEGNKRKFKVEEVDQVVIWNCFHLWTSKLCGVWPFCDIHPKPSSDKGRKILYWCIVKIKIPIVFQAWRGKPIY